MGQIQSRYMDELRGKDVNDVWCSFSDRLVVTSRLYRTKSSVQ